MSRGDVEDLPRSPGVLQDQQTKQINRKTHKEEYKLSPVHVLLGKSFCRFDYYHIYIYLYMLFSVIQRMHQHSIS